MMKELILKFASRKLLVFIVSTVLLCVHIITQDIWAIMAAVYTGSKYC
jgi:hypothetical protein